MSATKPSVLPPSLHPLIRSWFKKTYGGPTPVQAEAWPAIASGAHVLALAPTGSGKTLAAFLVALSRFADGTYPADRLSVLYVSPLKALNEDIKRNLTEPLASIKAAFVREGSPFPEVRVETRSGDTPQADRRRFLTKPPSILAVTPESLAILLLNPRARLVLAAVRCVVLDEIHAVLATKRGAFLACQVARLVSVAGEFQRLALSATVRPPETAAAFVGGLRIVPHDATAGAGKRTETRYERREVRIIAPPSEKRIKLSIEYPEGADRYTVLTGILAERTRTNRTTLVFTDSRRRAERISLLLNEKAGPGTAFAHHGSLSKDVRRAVEHRLIEGTLPCVVATGSLELGIDVGSVDEVVLAGSPSETAVALQRIGRSGHGVGLTSRGVLVPFHGMDLLHSAALAGAVRSREIEEVHPVANPLDLLGQTILALCVESPRNIDTLYDELRSFPPFENLSRLSYEGVVEMLAGRYADARLRDLKPRLFYERNTGLLTAADGVLGLLYSSGGTIPDRGYYSLRLEDGTRIGDLDEEFVWERRKGDVFSFGTRAWRIVSIGPEAVQVVPLDRSADFMPFWKAEARSLSPVLVRRTLELLSSSDAVTAGEINGGGSGLSPESLSDLGFSNEAADALVRFVDAQRQAQGGVPLPGKSTISIELCADPDLRGDTVNAFIHTLRGLALNQPLALALAAELENGLELRVETIPDDDGVLVVLPLTSGADPEALIRAALDRLGDPATRDGLLRSRLESAGVFGAAFREAAERSLILPRSGFGKRTPLWITRQRSKRLFDAVSGYGDFPAAAEAWRSCLVDLFDMEAFTALCDGLGDHSVRLGFFRTRLPSPFARNAVWRETNRFLYEGDENAARRGSSLSDRLIRDAIGEARLRPLLRSGLVRGFSARLRRELPGWAPEEPLALAEWVKERVAIPADEWEVLLAAAGDDIRESLGHDPSLGGRILRVRTPGAGIDSIVHEEQVASWRAEPLASLGEWLRYQGAVSAGRIAVVFGCGEPELDDALEALVDTGDIVRDVEVEADQAALSLVANVATSDREIQGSGLLICDRENLELLLRLSRKAARPVVRERPIGQLAPFLARRQGLIGVGGGVAGHSDLDPAAIMPWKLLSGYTAPVRLWETEIFPARLAGYRPGLLDAELAAGRLVWFGSGEGRIALCAPEDLDVVLPASGGEGSLFGDADRPRDFWELRDAVSSTHTLTTPAASTSASQPTSENFACTGALWSEVWAGRLSSDTWESLRRGLLDDFGKKADHGEQEFRTSGRSGLAPYPSPFGPRRRLPRALKAKWRDGPPVAGLWFSLVPEGNFVPDSLDQEELDRERVRLLLGRWGVLCRDLLEREEPLLSWSRLLPAMRRMELAGELTAGRFFSGLPGLQFAGPDMVGELDACDAENGVYWMNAADPASLCGMAAEGLDPELPARSATSRLCFAGNRLVAVSRQNGKDLRVLVPADDPLSPEILGFLKSSRTRAVDPDRKLVVERVNGSNASTSPWAGILRSLGFEEDRGRMLLW